MRRTYTAAIREDGSCLLEMLEVADPPATTTITVSGELGRDSAHTVEAVSNRLPHHRSARLVVDLCQVGVLDAVGLGALVRLERAASAAEIQLVVRCVPGPLSRLLRTVGMSHHVVEGPGGASVVPPVELTRAGARPPWERGRRGGTSAAVLCRRWH